MNWNRILIASLLAAIVAFVWGFLSWALLPWHRPMKFKDSAAVAQAIKANAPDHGIYMIPDWGDDMSDEAARKMEEDLKNAPFVWAMVHPAPTDSGMVRPMIFGFLRAFVAAVILCILLSYSSRESFACRVRFCVLTYLLVSINGDGPFWIWFHGPLQNFLIMTADHLIEGLLVGLVLAKFIRPAAAKAQA
jgi:hypothetical protein